MQPRRPLLQWIDDEVPLPPPWTALGADSDAPGLVAAGGRVTPERLAEAYRNGIFPWFSAGQPVLWWSPDPRMVLRSADFRLSNSMRKTLRRFLRRPGCEFRFDSAFRRVIEACATTLRDGQDGTWIVPAVADAYALWHAAGHVHSVETWVDGELVGGLYFVSIGRMCFGESMFSHRTDASKLALAALVAACRARGIDWIDCQQNTGHLASFGAREVSRDAFLAHLAATVDLQAPAAWTYDPAAFSLIDGVRTDPARSSLQPCPHPLDDAAAEAANPSASAAEP